MSIKNTRNQILFSIIILLISFKSITYQIEVPVKLIKTNFQKVVTKKISTNDDDSSTQSISDPLNHLDNYLFAIDLTIGSNDQKFTILLDTGSEIFWVPGSDSTSSKKKYNPSNSQTSSKSSEKMIYEYSSGTISGYFYNDQINFLSSRKYNAYFGVASNIDLVYYFFDGIMGLARRYSDTKKSILHTLQTNGVISSTKFSFKYDYNSNQANIYIDEIHNDFQSSDGSKTIASCPLINSAYYGKKLWVCNIVSLGIKQGDNIIKKLVFNIEGLFDTGTNNVIFPSKYLEELQSTLTNLNCYIYEEGNNMVGSQKAIYCRNKDDLPKITIGLPKYILTLGNSNFYNKIYNNNEYVYRLRFLFVKDVDFCIIGQNFFYEYHTLFDDDSGTLKFCGDDDSKVVYHVEDVSTGGMKTWILVFIIVGSILIAAGITAIILICCCCWRKPQPNIVLNKELLEMSSIQKAEDENENDDDNEEKTFNQIMSITSDKKYKGIKINVHTKPK